MCSKFVKIFSLLLSVLITSDKLYSQLRLSLQTPKKVYVKGEPIYAILSLQNMSSIKLKLENNASAPWLKFFIKDKQNKLISNNNFNNFNSIILKGFETVTKKINLSKFYYLGQFGNYKCEAFVATTRRTHNSNPIFFSVSDGTTFWKSTVSYLNDSKKETLLEYSLLVFHSIKGNILYFRLKNKETEIIKATYPLGNYLNFQKPSADIDKKGNLHVLFHSSPMFYGYFTFSPKGYIINKKYFRQKESNKPKLVINRNKEISIFGGIPYEESDRAKQIKNIRKLSNQPLVLNEHEKEVITKNAEKEPSKLKKFFRNTFKVFKKRKEND